MQPMLSIIIPVYNAEQFLKECLESVHNQNYSDYEVIIVNDGSTDKSRAIINEYCQADSRFICLDQDNQGAGNARNTGVGVSKGKYILFLDADDMLDKDTLADLMPIAILNDLDMIHMNWKRMPHDPINPLAIQNIDKDTVIDQHQFFQYYVKNIMQLTFICIIFKSYIIDKNHIRFKTKFAEDILFNMHALLCCSNFYFTKKEYYLYRRSMNGLTSGFFNNCELVYDRNKAVIEMFGLSLSSASNALSLSQKADLRSQILEHAGMRYVMFQELLFKELMNTKTPLDGKIAFWGAGKNAMNYIKAMQGLRLQNAVFVDNDPNKQGGELCGYPIITPMEMRKPQFADYKILITIKFILEAYAQLLDLKLVKSFMDMRLDIGPHEQYDIQLRAMDDLFAEICKLQIEIDYPGKVKK